MQDARWLALAAPGLIFAGHAFYGAMLPKTALTLALLAALMLAGAALAPGLRRDLDRLRPPLLPAAAFALVLLMALWSLTPFAPGGPHPVWDYADAGTAATSVDKSQTLLEFTKLLGLAAVFGLGLALGGSDGRARAGANMVVALGAALAAWSFLEWAGGDLDRGIGRQRLEGPFEAANTAATLFGVLLVLTLGLAASAVRGAPPGRRLTAMAPFLAAALLFLFSLIATASRAGLASTAAGLAVFVGLQLFGRRQAWPRAALLALAGLALLAGAIFVGGDVLVDRFLEDDLAEDGRAMLFQAHWDAFKAAPWLGYGLGSFDLVNRLILNAGNIEDIWATRAAHNVYVTWLEQAGVLGAAPMFACVGAIMWASLRGTLRRNRLTSPLYGLLAANVVFLVHGAFDFALETYSMAALWSLLLGLQFAASQGRSRR